MCLIGFKRIMYSRLLYANLLILFSLLLTVSFPIVGQLEHSVDKPLEITVTVYNPSKDSLQYVVKLYVNKTLITSKIVSVPPESSVNATMAWTPKRAGTYEIYVRVEAGGEVVKEEKYTVNVIGQPDLKIQDVIITPESYGPGDTIVITVVVVNDGTAPSQGTTIALLFGSEEIAREEIPPLDPDETFPVNFTYHIPQNFTNGSLIVDLDPDNLIDEVNESNSYEIEVTPVTETSSIPETSVQETTSITPVPTTSYTPISTSTSEEITESSPIETSTPVITESHTEVEETTSEVQRGEFPLIYLLPVLIGIALAGAYYYFTGVSGGEGVPRGAPPRKPSCCLDWEFQKGGGIEISVPDELVVPYGGALPLYAHATDIDSVVVRCIPCGSGESKTSPKVVPIPDTLKFEWEIVSGGGSLISAARETEQIVGSGTSTSHQLATIMEGYWPYRSQAVAEGPSVIYAAPQPPECNMVEERKWDGSKRMRRKKKVEEVVTVKLTVYDLQGKVEQLDDRGKEGRGVTKTIKIRVVDDEFSSMMRSVGVSAGYLIPLRDRLRYRYIKELLETVEDGELKRKLKELLDEWWKGVVESAEADEDLLKRSSELNREIAALVDELRSFKEIEDLMSMGSGKLYERIFRGGEVTIMGRKIEPLVSSIKESIDYLKRLVEELKERCEELKRIKKKTSDMKSGLEKRWQEISSQLSKLEPKGGICEPAVKWFPDGPIVGDIISPPWKSVGSTKLSQDGGASHIKVRTVPVLEVTKKEGEKEKKIEVYPTMTILPGQPVPFRAIGKDVDKLRMECSNGFSKEITLNDLLFYYWKAKWLDEPRPIWEDLAELPQIAGGIEKISTVMDGVKELLEILDKIKKKGGVDEDLRLRLKYLYRRYRDVEWFRDILMRYTTLGKWSDDAEYWFERDKPLLSRLREDALPELKRSLEEVKTALKSLAKSLMELDPTGKFFGDGGETVVFRAPHAEGFLELNCGIVDSGMQAPDGKVSVTRYIEIAGIPPWLSFLYNLNRTTEDLTKLRRILDSYSWTSVDRFWDMLEYICHSSDLKGLRSHFTLNFRYYKKMFSALLEPSEWEDLEEIVMANKRDVIYKILKDLSVRDSMTLLLRFYKLLLDEQFVLKTTMSWREALLWGLVWIGFFLPFLPAALSLALTYVVGGLSVGLSFAGMTTSPTPEGLPEGLTVFEGVRRLSSAVQELSAMKDSLDRSTAERIDSLLREYQPLDTEERRGFVKKIIMETGLMIMNYLLLYFQGYMLLYLFDNPECTPRRERAAISEGEILAELQKRVKTILDKVDNVRQHNVDDLATDLAASARKLAGERAVGPGMIQTLEEYLRRSLEADIFLASM